MKCYCCNQETWHSLAELNKERELQVCKNCGTVAYKVESNDEDKVRDYYRTDYRSMPNHTNLLTTTNKQNYIACFLRDFLKNKKGLIVGDVGCATGYLVKFFRDLGHKATGSEYTITFRRFAEAFYGIPITEELRDDVKYDLIIIYHVLEHMVEPDKKLEKYAGMLKDDGHLLIATPTYYDVLENAAGPDIIRFEELWHKNHINVFSEQSLKNLFRKAKLFIEKEDHIAYGQTYLLRKMTASEATEDNIKIVIENWEERVKQTYKGRDAIQALASRKFKEASEIWPKCPEAWLGLIFQTFSKDPHKQEDLWKEAFALMPKNKRLTNLYACLWLYQQGRYAEVIETLKEPMIYYPDAEKHYTLGLTHAMMGDHANAFINFYRAAELNPLKWQACMDYVCREASQLSAWDERALAKMSEAMVKETRSKLRLRDPLFDNDEKKNDVPA